MSSQNWQVLMFVQRIARMLKNDKADRPITATMCLQYFVREFGHRPEWLMMLAMSFEMRSLEIGAPPLMHVHM